MLIQFAASPEVCNSTCTVHSFGHLFINRENRKGGTILNKVGVFCAVILIRTSVNYRSRNGEFTVLQLYAALAAGRRRGKCVKFSKENYVAS